MKAVVYERYGPPEVLHLTEIAKPTPKDNEVLIKVRATTVTVGDSRMRSFTVPRAQWLFARLYLGIRKPRRPILGMELAGDVEAVGKHVTRYRVGDAVFASTFEVGFGGYVEYKCLPADGNLAPKPTNLTYEEAAAAVGGGITALRTLRQANIQPGQQVLIYGASGAVGTNAVQIAARHFGAAVTGVCSTSNLEMVQALGAARVIDYTQADFTEDGPIYDVVFDAVAKASPEQCKQLLKPTGIYLNVHKHSSGGSAPNQRNADLLFLKSLIEAGKLKPVIDRCYPLEEIVEAHRYVDQGHKRGNVAITVSSITNGGK
ncbi:MAG: NAD(P)-dependent alcohol dehydrogenase [Chloroflexi bacterium]|nr:NAD(P)-dependent alcohol dehydrogenase [Chloroflexota bacterium]